PARLRSHAGPFIVAVHRRRRVVAVPAARRGRVSVRRRYPRPVGRYPGDVLAGDWRRRRVVPEVDAEPDLVVEDAGAGFGGAVVGFESGAVVLEDRHGRRRNFPLLPAAFLLDGAVVTLRRPVAAPAVTRPRRTASGSVAVPGAAARVARASRIWVEGIDDAARVHRLSG